MGLDGTLRHGEGRKEGGNAGGEEGAAGTKSAGAREREKTRGAARAASTRPRPRSLCLSSPKPRPRSKRADGKNIRDGGGRESLGGRGASRAAQR